MKRLLYNSIYLLILMTIFSACNGGGLSSKKTFTGTVEIIYQTDRRYPDGRDSTFTRIETFEEVFVVKKAGKNTYEIVEWESGCDLNICCIPVPCPGEEFSFSEENELRLYWDYDFDNELIIKFDDKFKEVEATYWYSDGYFTDYYDESGGSLDTVLYRKLDQEFYTFKGLR